MDKEICNVSCIDNGEEKNAIIELIENENSVMINFILGDLVLTKASDNFFDALLELRKELEKTNIKLLCKGCSRNVYPSGMLLSMGSGRKAYSLTYGLQARTEALVDIFESCSYIDYATIGEQLAYFEGWASSLGSK